MFKDISNSLSKLFSRSWPTADGEVTSVTVDSCVGSDYEAQLIVTYKFSVAGEPYTGEASSSEFNGLPIAEVSKGLQGIHEGDFIAVRYRPDDPTVNKANINDLLQAL